MGTAETPSSFWCSHGELWCCVVLFSDLASKL
jgi:hypothetical protein